MRGDFTVDRHGLHTTRRAGEQAHVQTLLRVGHPAAGGEVRESERFDRGHEAAASAPTSRGCVIITFFSKA